MNGFEAQTVLLDSAAGAAQLEVNWLLQSTLLIAAGLAIAWLLRRRGSPRHL